MTDSSPIDYAATFEKRPTFTYPQFDTALEQLSFTYNMQSYSKRLALVVGVSGTGKSMVAQAFVNKLNRGNEYPIAYRVELNRPKSITVLLEQIAAPLVTLSTKVGESSMRYGLCAAIQSQNIKFIAIDNAHHALPIDENCSLKQALSEEFNHLNDSCDATFVLFGTEPTESNMLEAEYKKLSFGRLETRTNAIVRMHSFKFDETWFEAMKYMLSHIAAPHVLKLNNELLFKMFVATDGNFMVLNDLLIGAHVLVDQGQFNVIDDDTLAWAFDHVCSKTAANPFLTDFNSLKEIFSYLEYQTSPEE
ncbi:ATP-binding protein [Thalassotalea sp. PS06]|uniref:ATP-binding protein n=1 Tax=Thalassotalea sp. PS06 TaxID=2594005 RepID=UPI0011641886|nr:ATP-binding protein [Thalassotalea sp. PS06]QDP00232.1 ATP-binding protein [Thalassotalea sp. PS06]